MTLFTSLLDEVYACTRCTENLPYEPKPILQIDPQAKILIVGQAPGRKAHEAGIPFDDASGDRLREWMGISREQFYDPKCVAILPMGFCFPGTGKSGDLRPRPECAPAWRDQLLSHLQDIELTLVIGQYAQNYHLHDKRSSLTETVRAWKTYWPKIVPLPHPSPRNNIWLNRNPWFQAELLPKLRQRVSEVLDR
ncbi:uracil-DNA glycosylase family protein [Neptuniibacter marinus]|uniref:uracil-DNA glycosylase family protein n=1 Tax=Neptuniibacter marinus TaxID=1806670 RepID=UPI00082EAB09|nr:uracil-DNA glycosylase family protein [Neptuniibacter marinus]